MKGRSNQKQRYTGKALLQFAFLVTVGCMQLTGDVLGFESLKALGAISHASPAPRVFTTHRGYETYSPVFTVIAVENDQRESAVTLTPELNQRIKGPYNRRNAYGAALSYGPVLVSDPRTRPMFESAFRYAFCGPSTLRSELGLPNAATYRVLIQRRSEGPETLPTRFEVSCMNGKVETI